MNKRVISRLEEQVVGSQIDLTQWQGRLEVIAEVLREFGLAQFRQLLMNLPAQTQEPPLDLAAHLPGECVRWLAPRTRLPDLAGSGVVLKEAVRLASVGRISLNVLRARSLDHIRHQLGDPQDHLPDQLLPLLGEMAWSDLMFRYRVAHEIRAFFRQEVLFAKGDDHAVILSVKVFWLLIALSVQMSLLRTQSLRVDSVAVASGRAAARLAEHGAKEACSEHWAGFWEQWLVARISERWPQAFAKLDADLRVSLLRLPVLEGRGRDERVAEPGTSHGQSDLAVSGWQDHVPGWYRRHIGKESIA